MKTLIHPSFHSLIALLLICSFQGCHSRENCEQFRNSQVDSMEWKELLKRADQCLTPDEIRRLKSDRKRFEDVLLPELFGEGETIQQVLDGEKQLPAIEAEAQRIVESESRPARPSDPASKAQAPFGPWVIQEAVLFLFTELKGGDGDVNNVPDATAFVLSVPDKSRTKFLRFLVTARHVLEPEWAHCKGANPDSIMVRLNKKKGGVGFEKILLTQDGTKGYFTPPNDDLDLAVIPLTVRSIPHLAEYQFFDVPFRLLPTDAEKDALHSYQEIYTAGLLPENPGKEQNYPIGRKGILSNLPREPMKVACGAFNNPKSLRVWFISATIPNGVSGAPVFTLVNRGSGAENAPMLIGVQSISWTDKELAGITPSTALVDLIQELTKNFEVDLYRGR